jgi:hypothetical protein
MLDGENKDEAKNGLAYACTDQSNVNNKLKHQDVMWPADRLSRQRHFVVFLTPCRQMYLKLCHDCFLPNPLQFIIQLSLHSMLHARSY